MGRRSSLLLGLAVLAIGNTQGSQTPTDAQIDEAVELAQAHVEECRKYPEGLDDATRNGCITYCQSVADKATSWKQSRTNHALREYERLVRVCTSRVETAQKRMGHPATAATTVTLGRRGLDAVDQMAKAYRETCATTYRGETAERCIAACDTAIQAVQDVLEGRPTDLATAEGVRQSSKACTSASRAAGEAYSRQLAAAPRPPDGGSAAGKCDRRLTGKLCIRAEASLAKATQAMLGNLGLGQSAEDLIRKADRVEMADTDNTGVIRPSGASRVLACNGSKRVARVASLRWSCIPSAVLHEENYQCDLNFSGWAEFAPEQCRPLRFSGDALMLAVYRQDETGNWRPSIYSEEDGRVDFDSAVDQPAPSLRMMLEGVCGRTGRDFHLSRVDNIHPRPHCRGELEAIILNLSIRAHSSRNFKATF